MLKIRLMRIGDRKKPFYRVVVVDERNKRTGGYIENVGTYNPLTEPKEIKLNKERIEHWIKMGAQKSDGFLRIIGEAPQKKPRKPKKEKKELSVVSPQSSDSAASQPATAEEPKTEEAPKEKEVVAEETPTENKEADGAPTDEGAKTE